MTENNNEKIQICCKSCGAIFDNTLASCPYCKSTNIIGAEIEYMNKLEDIKDNIQQLQEMHKIERRKEVKKQGKKVLLLILIPIIIIAILLASAYIFDYIMNPDNYKTEEEKREELLWEKETFLKLDELYEQEKYTELITLVNEYEENDLPIDSWEHYEFILLLDIAIGSDEYIKKYKTIFEVEDYQILLQDYMLVEKAELNAKEREYMQPYQAEIFSFLENVIGITQNDIEYLRTLSYDVLDMEIGKVIERSIKK